VPVAARVVEVRNSTRSLAETIGRVDAPRYSIRLEKLQRYATASGVIRKDGAKLAIREERREIVRQYLLLDTLSISGRQRQPRGAVSAASVLVSGHGAFFGLEMDELVNEAMVNAGELREDISHSQTFAADIKALSQRGFTMMR